MAILYKNKTTKWICRIYFNQSKKFITIPNEDKKEERININNVYEIENYSSKLESALKNYMK